ncbi:MAG: universal stress protein [Steroidobacteraceae bacterium]
MNFQRILVAAADCSMKNSPALVRASAISRQGGGTITLFHSLYSSAIAGESVLGSGRLKKDIQAALRQRKQQLEAAALPLRRAGMQVRTRVSWDYPVHESIVREALRERSDLVIAESQRHTRLARIVLSNTDWQLIRVCPAPVLFVKGTRSYERARIIAAVDPLHAYAKPRELDADILAMAADLARSFNGRLHAAHFYQLATPFTSGVLMEPVPLPVNVSATQLERIRREFAALIGPYELPERRRHLRAGNAADEIVALAARIEAAVVVMGAISRSGLRRLFVGSTAERVIDRVDCDVLVLKPTGFRSPVPRRRSPAPVVLPPI